MHETVASKLGFTPICLQSNQTMEILAAVFPCQIVSYRKYPSFLECLLKNEKLVSDDGTYALALLGSLEPC